MAPALVSPHLWAIVLAGSEDAPARSPGPASDADHGPGLPEEPPGPRFPLRQALGRVTEAVPPARMVVVSDGGLAGPTPFHVLAEPVDRGTAASILYPVHWIYSRDRLATVVVFPSGPLVRQDEVVTRHATDVAGFVARHREWIVLLGAEPTGTEGEHGWIEPGRRVGSTPLGPILRVRRFQDRPSAHTARLLLAGGGLCNTMVFAASASTLLGLGRQWIPALHDRLARIVATAGSGGGDWRGVCEGFAGVPRADFSLSVLERQPSMLAVSRVPDSPRSGAAPMGCASVGETDRPRLASPWPGAGHGPDGREW